MISIPFLGSKRNYVRPVEEIVLREGYEKVFEPFGGSGVLSVNLFNDGLVSYAAINDYDKMFDLYPNYLDIKEEIINKLLARGIEKSKKRLPKDQREYLQELIGAVDEKYWGLLANNFVFSPYNTCELRIKNFCYLMSDLGTERQRKYLEIISQMDRVSLDYKDYFEYYSNKFDSYSLIILDPPYLNSAQKHYSNDSFFGLADTIDLLHRAKAAGADFLFFNMVERDTTALLNLYDFDIEETQVKFVSMNRITSREDVMVFVRQTSAFDRLWKVS